MCFPFKKGYFSSPVELGSILFSIVCVDKSLASQILQTTNPLITQPFSGSPNFEWLLLFLCQCIPPTIIFILFCIWHIAEGNTRMTWFWSWFELTTFLTSRCAIVVGKTAQQEHQSSTGRRIKFLSNNKQCQGESVGLSVQNIYLYHRIRDSFPRILK